ncbi:MAG: hypothetical protein EB120_05325 [Proteobacteria bacterium]|nr:hypothetical protein [Pseudomonadota bacterium]
MNVELSNKEIELVFRGLMVLPWVEANHLILRLQNIAKNEDLKKKEAIKTDVSKDAPRVKRRPGRKPK